MPTWDRRGVAALACTALCVVIAFAYAGASWPIALYRLLTDGLLAVAWIGAAYGIGSLVPMLGGAAALRAVTRIAIGLGATSLITLGLGIFGAMSRSAAVMIVGAGIALCAWRLLQHRTRGADDVRQWWASPAGWAWLWALAMPLLGIALVGALVPPGVLWGDEPNGYDVVEYHLQVPREWHEAGRIIPLNHNVFSYFPFNVEMQFLLAMHLRGGPWAGMYLAQLMHVAYVALSVAAVWAAARAVGGNGTIAGVAAAGAPWLTLLAPVAYNEGGLLLYGTLAVAWTLVAVRDPEHRVARMAVAGAMGGLACGVKLTAVPMLLLPLPLVMLAIAAARREPIGRALLAAVVFGVVGIATFGPWLARNAAWAGNPVFPEGQAIFGRGHFTETQAQRWKAAHAPRADQRGVGAKLSAAVTQIVIDARYGIILLPLALVAAMLARRSPQAWLLMAMLAVFAVVWLGLTHLQSRFFVLAIPIAALLIAQLSGRASLASAALVGVMLIVSFVTLHRRVTSYLHEKQLAQVLGFEPIAQFMTPEAAGDVPADVTLILAGDAKAFCYQRPISRLRYRTVFDVAEGDWLSAWTGSGLPGEGRAVVLVDPAELRRFAQTYAGLPPVPPDVLEQRAPFLINAGDR